MTRRPQRWTHLADVPLRPRKQAQTRIALVEAALARLDGTRTLDQIPVKELCEAAQISEASFFNYFPKKDDLLLYFIQLWSLDLSWRLEHEPGDGTARGAIETIFVATARDARRRPGILAEVLAYQARLKTRPRPADVPLAERLAAFPGRAEIGDVPARGLDGLLPPLVARAVGTGELPKHVDQQAAFLGLAAIFFGVPMALLQVDPCLVEATYRQQLSVFWAGLEHGTRRTAPRPRAARGRRTT